MIHTFNVVGVKFEGRQEILKGIYEEHGRLAVPGELIAEPDNEYDPNAIGVHVDGEQIGYIGKGDTAIIWDHVMANGGEMPDMVAVMVDHANVGKGWERHLVFFAKIALDID